MIRLKSILAEGYAWEREAGKPLPTMKSVQEKYQKSLKEQDGQDINYQVMKTPTGKFKIGVISPRDGKLYDAFQYFRGGTFWQTEYASQQEAQAAIASIRAAKTREAEWQMEGKLQKSLKEEEDLADDALALDAATNSTVPSMQDIYDVYHEYKNGDVSKKVFYMFMAVLEPHEKDALIKYIKQQEPGMMQEFVSGGYDSHRMSALMDLYHQYKDGGMSRDVFVEILQLINSNERDELMAYIKTRRDGDNYAEFDLHGKAHDAKGVKEVKDKKPVKKSDKRSKGRFKGVRWQDNDGDGKWYEPGQDVKADIGSLEESTFWGRVKGNLHGHDYILREAFKK